MTNELSDISYATVSPQGHLTEHLKFGPITERLQLSQVVPGQALKSVTLNETLRRLDIVAQLSVRFNDVKTLTGPEVAAPVVGDTRIISDSPDPLLEPYQGAIACWDHSAEVWIIIRPNAGWRAYNLSDETLLVFDGGHWKPIIETNYAAENFSVGRGHKPHPDGNSLSVRGASTLLSGEVDELSGGAHRLFINKHDDEGTASVVFQSDSVAQAEIGLMGQNELGVKVYDGGEWKAVLGVDPVSGVVSMPLTPKREILTAPRTYYVGPDGSDMMDGLTPDRAKLTIQSAINAALNLDASGHQVIIDVAEGEYNEPVHIARPMFDNGLLLIRGNNATPHSVHLRSESGTALKIDAAGARVQVEGLKLSGVVGLWARYGAVIYVRGNVELGACQARQIGADNGAYVEIIGQLTLSGDNQIGFFPNAGGHILMINSDVAFMPGVQYANAFIHSTSLGTCTIYGNNFDGQISGRPYRVDLNSIIKSNGSADVIPSSIDGTAQSGGLVQ